MTSTTDEIANLRAALDHIRSWCAHELRYQTNDLGAAALKTVEILAERALKTPRASKVAESPRCDDGGGSGGFGH